MLKKLVGLFLLNQQKMYFTFGHWVNMHLNELITACNVIKYLCIQVNHILVLRVSLFKKKNWKPYYRYLNLNFYHFVGVAKTPINLDYTLKILLFLSISFMFLFTGIFWIENDFKLIKGSLILRGFWVLKLGRRKAKLLNNTS